MNGDKSSTPIYFYEFVALVIPGSVFLVITQTILGTLNTKSVLFPQSLGSLSIHILLAYICGTLLQGVGKYIENIYWFFWSGKPIDWPITSPKYFESAKIIKEFAKYNKTILPKQTSKKLTAWRHILNSIKSEIYANNFHHRLHVFLGHYHFVRGLITVSLIAFLELLCSATYLTREQNILFAAIVLLLFSRFHSFGINYAEELFSSGRIIIKLIAKRN